MQLEQGESISSYVRVKEFKEDKSIVTLADKESEEIIKKIEKIVKTDKAEAVKMLSTAFQAIDKAAQKGVIKKNNAANKKSRLARIVK